MKIAVFSDSHGDKESMKKFIDMLNPEIVLFLGDGIDDIRQLEDFYPKLRFDYVKGNTDLTNDVPNDKSLIIEGVSIFLTHGNNYGINKFSYDTKKITECALENKASIFLHGHAHTPTLWINKGITFMNPGTVKSNPEKGCPTCGLIYTYDTYFICKILFFDFLPFYEYDIGHQKKETIS